MNFTKDELRWIKKTSKAEIGDMLTELNQRTRQYTGMGICSTVKRAQKQALIDFQNFIKPGEFIATTEKADFDNYIYFKAAK